MYLNMNMNLWEKLMTALRGGISEAGEAIIDSQAMRILDQELREAAEELKQSKTNLVEIIARQKLAEEKSLNIGHDITKNEDYARQALSKNEQSLALEVAEIISQLQLQLDIEQGCADDFAQKAKQLRASIKQVEANIKRIKYQVDTVKATENVQRAQAAVLARHSDSNSRLHTAIESLERIKENQALKSARINAANEIIFENAGQSLNQRLQDAGISLNGKTADEILASLRSKDAVASTSKREFK